MFAGYKRRIRATTPAYKHPCFNFIGEFDPGSGRTLAACLIHASRAGLNNGSLRVEAI